jgi:uncharacterized protein (DUF433 family)
VSQPLKKHWGPRHGFPPCGTHSRDRFDKFPRLKEQESAYRDFEIPISSAFKRALKGRPSIEVDSDILAGVPHIVGTRIPVFMVLDAVEYYGTLEGVKKSYPKLTIEQIKDAVSFAAAVTEHPIDNEVARYSR